MGVVGPRHGKTDSERKQLESCARVGDSPLTESPTEPTGIPIRTVHVKRRLNPGGPPSKAKY